MARHRNFAVSSNLRQGKPSARTRQLARRSSLLFGTALGSTLLFAAPSLAAEVCGTPGPTPVNVAAGASNTTCNNTEARTANGPAPQDAIGITTTGGATIFINNSGVLTTT